VMTTCQQPYLVDIQLYHTPMAATEPQAKRAPRELLTLWMTRNDRQTLRLTAKERGLTQSALIRQALAAAGVPIAA